MFRSFLAILSGIVALTVASFAIEAVADPLMMRLFPRALPDAAALSRSIPAHLVMFTYTALSVAFGGYFTAWIARRAAVWHAVIMGAVEVGLTVWAMLALAHQAPLWSWIAGMIFTVPAAWLGGAFRAWQNSRHTSPQPA
jgi:hypothetical protein